VVHDDPLAWCDRRVIATTPQLGSFSDDARQAIVTSPNYFVWWYTAKSIGLGVAFAALAFMIGRATKGRR
jgi:hypothetical protein